MKYDRRMREEGYDSEKLIRVVMFGVALMAGGVGFAVYGIVRLVRWMLG